MVSWLCPAKAEFKQRKMIKRSIDICADFDIFSPFKDDRNGGKTERTWHLMRKTADTYVTEGQVTADNSVLSSFNSYVTKMPRTDT